MGSFKSLKKRKLIKSYMMNNRNKLEKQRELYINGIILENKLMKVTILKCMKIILYWIPQNLKIIVCFKIAKILTKFNKIHNGQKLSIQTCQQI